MAKRPLLFAVMCALVAVFVFSGVLSAEDEPFEKPMKMIGTAMKALKPAVINGDMAVVKTNAETVATQIESIKNLEPPINKDKKAQLPVLADKSIEVAKALAAATDATTAKAKYADLGASCKACHTLFQPSED